MMIKQFRLAILLATLLVALTVFVNLYYIPHPRADFGAKSKFMIIRKGETLHDVAAKLDQMGAISSRANFNFWARVLGKAGRMRVGRYEIKPHSSVAYLLGIISRGESSPFNITIPEGFTLAQIANLLEASTNMDADLFRSIVSDRRLIDSLGIQAETLEGYLAPSTYNVYYEENPKKIVSRMLAHFYQSFPDSFNIKANRLGLTVHQAVTLASMIEKEAMLDSERPIIAAVYLNRLRKGMKLECDPTVIYAMGGLDRPLLRKDLTWNSPYNTYLNFGLPPGPISNPGVKSLRAAVNPTAVGYYYFVAKGDGSHSFSYTLNDHINATIRIRRQNNNN